MRRLVFISTFLDRDLNNFSPARSELRFDGTGIKKESARRPRV